MITYLIEGVNEIIEALQQKTISSGRLSLDYILKSRDFPGS